MTHRWEAVASAPPPEAWRWGQGAGPQGGGPDAAAAGGAQQRQLRSVSGYERHVLALGGADDDDA